MSFLVAGDVVLDVAEGAMHVVHVAVDEAASLNARQRGVSGGCGELARRLAALCRGRGLGDHLDDETHLRLEGLDLQRLHRPGARALLCSARRPP